MNEMAGERLEREEEKIRKSAKEKEVVVDWHNRIFASI